MNLSENLVKLIVFLIVFLKLFDRNFGSAIEDPLGLRLWWDFWEKSSFWRFKLKMDL